MQSSRVYRRLALPLLLAMLCSILFLSTAQAHGSRHGLVGPKQYYLALGDSLAFGYQPDQDFNSGYDVLYGAYLQAHGGEQTVNLACNGESSQTFIDGTCPFPQLRKYPYTGSQLDAAVNFITAHPGQVSPVTLSIGGNDVLPFINPANCAIDTAKLRVAFSNLYHNLAETILPRLSAALTVNGKKSGDLVITTLYDPLQNFCPNTVPYIKALDGLIAIAAWRYAHVVDLFKPFGGASNPNPNICVYTWICTKQDIHPTDEGYQVIAQTLEEHTYN